MAVLKSQYVNWFLCNGDLRRKGKKGKKNDDGEGFQRRVNVSKEGPCYTRRQ